MCGDIPGTTGEGATLVTGEDSKQRGSIGGATR